MNKFMNEINGKVLAFDGSKGYMFQKMGLKGGECSEYWNITHKEEVKSVYKAYKDAGSDIIQTNTFPGNRIQLEKYSLGDKTYEINAEGARLAKEVMGKNGFVAGSIGPIGKLFEPSGELNFNEAYVIYKEQITALADGGVDIINFETFTDISEMRAALIAAKEVCDLPVICSISFEANGKTLMGTDPYIAALVLKSLGADMIGTNCSFGPEQLLDVVKIMNKVGGIYISVKPNAGLPEFRNGITEYNDLSEKFKILLKDFINNGTRLIGGCCGTTPELISMIKAELKNIEVPKLAGRPAHLISSSVKMIELDNAEKLNTGIIDLVTDKKIITEFKSGNIDYIQDLIFNITDSECDVIFIKANSEIKDDSILGDILNLVQGYSKEPIIIETPQSCALNKALRLYKGKAGVVVNGYSGYVLEELLKTSRKYGAAVIDKSILSIAK